MHPAFNNLVENLQNFDLAPLVCSLIFSYTQAFLVRGNDGEAIVKLIKRLKELLGLVLANDKIICFVNLLLSLPISEKQKLELTQHKLKRILASAHNLEKLAALQLLG